MIDLIIDRTQDDVDFAQQNKNHSSPLKGAYNASDYNRVGTALNYLSDWLVSLGYRQIDKLKTDWNVYDNFTPADGAQYLSTIQQFRNAYNMFPTDSQVPDNIRQLFGNMGFEWANNIEQLFVDVEKWITRMTHSIDFGWILGVPHIGLYGGLS